MARPTKEEKGKVYCMKIDPNVFRSLEDWRWQNRLTRSRAITIMIEKFLSNLHDDKKTAQKEFAFKD